MPECNRCGEPIYFVRRWRGKLVPCDQTPNPDWPLALIETEPGVFQPHSKHNCQYGDLRRLELAIARLNFGNGASGEIWDQSGLWKLDSNILEGDFTEENVEKNGI